MEVLTNSPKIGSLQKQTIWTSNVVLNVFKMQGLCICPTLQVVV